MFGFAEKVFFNLFRLINIFISCSEGVLSLYIMMGWCMALFPIKDSLFSRVYYLLAIVIEPTLNFIRKYVPAVAFLDFSPIIVFAFLEAARTIISILFSYLLGS